jgi:hypothetical protein
MRSRRRSSGERNVTGRTRLSFVLLVQVLAILAARPVASQDGASMAGLAFLAGTWCGDADASGTVIEEQYTTPSANLVLGTTRYLRGGATVTFELTRIEADGDSIVLYPMPRGRPSVGFRLVRLRADTAVFENLAHDFPIRILYRREGSALIARIEGTDGDGAEWRMTPCAREEDDVLVQTLNVLNAAPAR